ncbi:TerB family tellurite resistance protein [Mucilaginibacter endophyticus]|uniref:TerB family tellurite resistance protein n=1 Tax=Mucilaginibacter endophyticus TaxID=2675003 RepID=UPI000E0CE00A|nr:TerB family tellurite resistance protein [Mucilaginibacter endophyticus]
MKKLIFTILLTAGLCGMLPQPSKAQSVEDCIQQLILDYEKLASLKNILSQMYQGYAVLSKGYNAVKGVAQGNFSLHQVFLDGLYLVSPTVRKYPRITDIISDQTRLVGVYRQVSGSFSRSGRFKPAELAYMMKVYNNLISASLQNLDNLAMIVTDSQLRMSDAERLRAIDRLYLESHNQLTYLRRFNDQASAMAKQRALTEQDRQALQSIYGFKP